jgi:AcrR family transcriptional regulator
MNQIASEIGVAVGTLYRYAEGKDALFHACLVASSPANPPLSEEAPLPGATRDEIIETARTGLKALFAGSELDRALATTSPADAGVDLRAVITDLFNRTTNSRRFLALVEASAKDIPEFGQAFYEKTRRPLLNDLTRLLEQWSATGVLRPLPHPATTARLIVESQSWFARNLHLDPDSDDIDPDTLTETIPDVLLYGLLP